MTSNKTKILVVGGDNGRREAIKRAFQSAGGARFNIEFRSFARTAGVRSTPPDFAAAIVDFETDPKEAAHAAFLLRSARAEMGIAVIVPSLEFQTPVEALDLGLGPVVISDEEGIASLPAIAEAMTNGDEQAGSVSASSALRVRNQELRDITDSLARQSVHLIHLRNELAAEKSKLETVINGMTDGVIFFDVDGRLEMINPVATAIFPSLDADGYPVKDDFIKTIGRDAAAENRKGDDKAHSFDAMIGGKAYRIRQADVTDASGSPAGSLIMLMDITADKEYEKLKNDFTSMISHELRTPLTSIGAAVDNFISGALGEVTENQLKFLEMIRRNVDRQQALIDDLLDIAKFEAGQMELCAEMYSLPWVVNSCVEQFSLAYKDRKISLETRAQPDFPKVRCDHRLMTQAVNNLLSNALKFTEDGGSVVAAVLPEEHDGTPMACVCVSDTGIGIPHGQRERIFDKYTQLDSSTRRRYSGTGLGLAVVREIMKAHGGFAAVESEPGKGSVFKLFLPIRGEAA
ncbi:MAG: hypothetical protein HZB29_00275 [Nitrospinae bacterium]|nr:hypothetical protein [Nitrospinota bacterium]